jgi:hypothetical protein
MTPITRLTMAEPPRPMETAPRGHTRIKLLAAYPEEGGWTLMVDEDPSWTIGSNGFDHTGEDRWTIVGWNQDCVVEDAGVEVTQ